MTLYGETCASGKPTTVLMRVNLPGGHYVSFCIGHVIAAVCLLHMTQLIEIEMMQSCC